MNRLSRWALPALLGPLGSSVGIVILQWWLSRGRPPPPRPPIWDPSSVMLAIGVAMAVVLVAMDLALLAARVRRLPTGVRAWLVSASSVPLLLMVVTAMPPDKLPLYEPAAWLAYIVGVPLVLRLVFGERPG